MPAGRPTDYKPEYCQMLIDHMAEGLSFTSFAAIVGDCYDTISDWRKIHPEFLQAYKIGTPHRQLYLEKELLTGDPRKVAGVIFALKNATGRNVEDAFVERQEVGLTVNPLDSARAAIFGDVTTPAEHK